MGGKWAKPVSKGKKLGGIFAAQLGKLIGSMKKVVCNRS